MNKAREKTSAAGKKLISAAKQYWLIVAVIVASVVPSAVLQHNPVAGIYSNAAIIALLICITILRPSVKKIAVAATIIPVSFMIPFSLPEASEIAKLASLYGTILLLSLTYRFWFLQEEAVSRNSVTMSIKDYANVLPQAVVLGQVLGALVFFASAQAQPFYEVSMGLTVGAVIAFALVEAIFFQGLFQSAASEVLSPKIAALLASIAFIGLNGVGSTEAFIISAITGSSLAAFYLFKRSILPAMLANVVLKLVFVGLVAVQ